MNTVTEVSQVKESNSLRYSTNKIVGKEHIFVKIRLDDECKNGHQDFSITGDIYEAGKPKTDKYYISGGCIHEDILKNFPEFDIFIRLHLCDYKGIPMYPQSNMRYHLREGFNKTKPEDANFMREYCEYYRITERQFKQLNQSFENEIQFALALELLGIFDQWKEEADAAISYLEQLTGTKFKIDSAKSHYVPPTLEQRNEEGEKVKNGYYSPKAKAEREAAKIQKELHELEAERDKDIAKATIEFETKKAVLLTGGTKALKNCIFYTHTNTLTFNWRSYDMLSETFVSELISKLELPEGVTATNGKGK